MKYKKLEADLAATGRGNMKVFGNSMTPLIVSGSRLSYEQRAQYEVGDIVYCKVRGRLIDAHLVKAKSEHRGYLIANNKGGENGWTKTIFGKVVKAVSPSGSARTF